MRKITVLFALVIFAAGCSSSVIKEKRKERERLVQQSKLYCEFINAEIFPDTELELNVQMAKKCDPDKPMTMTQFKTPSENQGIMYCCSLENASVLSPKPKRSRPAPKASEKPDEKAPESDNKADSAGAEGE